MSNVLIISEDISPDFSESLSHALYEKIGQKPTIFSLHKTLSAGKFISSFVSSYKNILNRFKVIPKLQIEHMQVVHFSSIDCLAQSGLDFPSEDVPIIMVDATDFGFICQRGKLYECNRTLCRDARYWDRARCYAFRLDPLYDGMRGRKLFEKCLPDTHADCDAFLGICKKNNFDKFKSHFKDGAFLAKMVKNRLDAVRLLARVDAFLCSNQVVYQSLKDFGIDDIHMILDQTFIPLRGPRPEKDDLFKARVETLARAYNNDSLSYFFYKRGPKWQIERENSILLMQDLLERQLGWESRPSQIEFATNNKCNLQCIMCSPQGRPKGEELPENDTRAICDQVFPKASVLTPSAGSEPLLGNFELITELSQKYDVQLNLITNGVLLTPERYELMRRNLGRLHISFDSHEKETYEKIRVGAKFEKVTQNIREVCKLATKDSVEVIISAVIMKLNYNKIAEYIDFVADLGVDTVVLQKFLLTVSGLEVLDINHNMPKEEIDREIDRAIEAAKRCEVNLHVHIGEPRGFPFNKKKFKLFKPYYLTRPVSVRFPKICHYMATYLKIEPDGSVFPCCLAPRELRMGNIKHQPFDSIWNGKEYQQLRHEMFSGKLRKCCRECPIV